MYAASFLVPRTLAAGGLGWLSMRSGNSKTGIYDSQLAYNENIDHYSLIRGRRERAPVVTRLPTQSEWAMT